MANALAGKRMIWPIETEGDGWWSSALALGPEGFTGGCSPCVNAEDGLYCMGLSPEGEIQVSSVRREGIGDLSLEC